MSVTLAMYDTSLKHIGARLDALGLELSVSSFDADGRFLIDGAEVAPEEVAVDYLWLSSHINAGGKRQAVFDTLLRCESISVLQTFNAGLDNPFYRKMSDKGVRICNSDAQAVGISEYVLAQVLSLLHPVDLQRQQQADRQWRITPYREISQTHWLIVGFGPIGQAVAKRVKAFGAKVTVVRRTPVASELADRVGTMADLETFGPAADVVLLACPLTEATRGFADAGFFSNLKAGAILVNIARGPLIDDRALIAALDAGRLEAAVLDVFHTEPLPKDDSLWAHPKVRLTPHTSFAGSGVQTRWDQLFLDNIARFCNGDPLALEVDPKDI